MYREYLFNISDYFCLLKRSEARFEFVLPLLIGAGAFVSAWFGLDLYFVVVEIMQVLEIVLGFLLAVLALFVTINESKVQSLKEYMTERKLGGKKVSLYRYYIIEISYLIFVAAVLCMAYLLGLIIPCWNEIVANIMNSIFVLFSFHVLFAIIRAMTSLSFILQKEEK